MAATVELNEFLLVWLMQGNRLICIHVASRALRFEPSKTFKTKSFHFFSYSPGITEPRSSLSFHGGGVGTQSGVHRGRGCEVINGCGPTECCDR
ncbi:hypothetical protein E2C01_074841 [Portunus trituberculatus]|uniref:Uncharacterized protein n=1 Tax=Portunus trituberculatus TaxID=210409 RepID=A0A5B7IFB9_PORTR|nr:hypothetical protein [Portunus trituberculatus]